MKISLPPHVVSLIQTLHQAVDIYPLHELLPKQRQFLYTAIGSRSDPLVNTFRCWWAIYTAESVLSRFTAALPDEVSPVRSLKLARRIAQGTLNRESKRVQYWQKISDDWSSEEWGLDEDERTEFPTYASYAGIAANDALDEVCDIEDLRIKNFTTYLDTNHQELEMQDIYLAGQDSVDTACCAAIAFACDKDSNFPNSDKLHQFWTWWLTEAIERAWQTATEE